MRKVASLICALGLLVCVSAAAEEVVPEMAVSKYGKVYANADLTLQMVTISGSKSILARFTGAPAEEETIDGRVLQYDAIPSGTGTNYRGRGKGGTSVDRIQSRPVMGDSIEVWFQNKSYQLKLDEKATKTLATSGLLNDFRTTRGKPGP